MPWRCAPLDCSASLRSEAGDVMPGANLSSHDERLAAAVHGAARAIARGELVAFPTETVYGLGARADDDAAVAAIFAAKGRPKDHPLIVHVAGPRQAAAFTPELSRIAQRLVAAFWPGPLTIVVNRAPGMAGAAAGGHASIALRCPAHPVAQALLADALELGVPGIAAPSANRFGRISPTTAQHVRDDLGPDLLVLDGGPCEVGIESAIVDCRGERPVLLRPGALSRAGIEAAAGQRLLVPDRAATPAPGTLASHYAPRAILRLLPGAELQSALVGQAPDGTALAVYSRSVPADPRRPGASPGPWRAMPGDAAAAARELFAALRDLDRPGIEEIWVEEPPDLPEWEGVRDRLRRAAEPDAAPRPGPQGKALEIE